MDKNKDSFKSYLIIAGSYIAFCVGASFSTGNELMQYFSSWGSMGLLGGVISVALMLTLIVIILKDAQKYRLADMKSLFIHYGGKYLGMALYVYTVFYLFVLVVMLISGAGAVFEEHFGINNMLGRAVLTAFMFVTVILGLNKMLELLGKLAYAILILMVITAIIGICNPTDGLSLGSELALARDDLARQSTNWFVSGLMYFSWAILCQTSFATALAGNTLHTPRERVNGMYLGGIGFLLLTVLPSWAIISNMSVCGGSSIPAIEIAKQINPIYATIYCIIVVIAIYTTCSPICWSVASAFMSEKNKNFKWAVAVLLVLGFAGSNLGSFTDILYTGTSISAYVGFVFIATILVTMFIRKPAVPIEKTQTEEIAAKDAVVEG